MHAEIISIGDELLSGESKIIDTNSIHITEVLRRIGVVVRYKTTVGDHEARITEVLRIAARRADIVITTGGLGPTVDDVTRQAVAAAAGRPLIFRQDLLDQIADRFCHYGVPMSKNNRQQAYIPEGAIALPNANGTAPSFILKSEQTVFASLPGVPSEMKAFLAQDVIPYLVETFGLGGVLKTHVLHLIGIGESHLDALMGDLMKRDNPVVGLAAHGGPIDIRIYARGADEAEADAVIAGMVAELQARVGRYIYGAGGDQLEAVLLRRLTQEGLTAATIESGTGRALAKQLEACEAEVRVIRACDTHIDIDMLREALDDLPPDMDIEALACTAADHIRAAHRADIGLALIAAPDQGGTAMAAVARFGTRSRRYGPEVLREDMARWLTNHALGLAWRLLAERGDTDTD